MVHIFLTLCIIFFKILGQHIFLQLCLALALYYSILVLNFSVASQSEITRRLEKSGLDNDEPNGESKGFLSRSEITQGEHPLSLGKTSVWNQFFQVLVFFFFMLFPFFFTQLSILTAIMMMQM